MARLRLRIGILPAAGLPFQASRPLRSSAEGRVVSHLFRIRASHIFAMRPISARALRPNNSGRIPKRKIQEEKPNRNDPNLAHFYVRAVSGRQSLFACGAQPPAVVRCQHDRAIRPFVAHFAVDAAVFSAPKEAFFPTIWTNAGTQFSQERHVGHPGSRLLRADVLKQSGS